MFDDSSNKWVAMEQVQLYDENERLLESKVLGKDDVLESGQTLIMQAHLVDISLSTIKVGKENCSVSSVRKPFQKPASPIHSFVDSTNLFVSFLHYFFVKSFLIKFFLYTDICLRCSQEGGSLC